MGFLNGKPKPRQPQPIAAITAGGSTYRASNYEDFTEISLLKQNWQRSAFDIYDTEGHLFYATNYVGGALARIRLVAATKPKTHGQLEDPKIIEDGPVADAIAEIASPTGGQSGFLRQIGRNIFLTGEAWVIASTVKLPDGKIEANWDAVSVEELVNTNGQRSRRTLPGAQPKPLPEDSLTFRIWKEHPRYSQLADSGTRSCIDLLEKIIILNRAEKAVARSQLAGSGILALPQELVPPAWQNQGDTANPMEANPLWQALAESMTAPLRDESAPSAVVPLLLVGPGEVIKNMKYEPLNRRFDAAAAQASIKMAIEQIANTLELPKEILLGVGEATHWTAWAIREDVFQAHIQPLIELVCAGLTKTFLRQALSKFSDAELKKAGIDSRDDVVVWYDASQLVIQPDRADKISAAHDRFVVTDDAYAKALDIPKEDRLDKNSEEYKKRVGLKMVDPKMAVTGEVTEPPAPAAPGGAPGGGSSAGPKVEKPRPIRTDNSDGPPRTLVPSRGKSPGGARAGAPLIPSQRRANPGLPQQSRTLTAAAANTAGTELGRFDQNAMKSLRELAEKHVSAAVKEIGLTASASPADFIKDEFLDEFIDLANLIWVDGIGLVNSLFADFTRPLFQSAVEDAIVNSASFYFDILKDVIDKKTYKRRTPIYGEFMQGDMVQYGDVRPLLTRLGGGSPDIEIPLHGGVATGNTMTDWMGSNGVELGDQKIWLYGWEESPRRRMFNGHLQMDGLVFEDWQDEGLMISPQDAWLRRSHYAPGDHWGCSCIVAPYIPNYGEDFRIEFPSE